MKVDNREYTPMVFLNKIYSSLEEIEVFIEDVYKNQCKGKDIIFKDKNKEYKGKITHLNHVYRKKKNEYVIKEIKMDVFEIVVG